MRKALITACLLTFSFFCVYPAAAEPEKVVMLSEEWGRLACEAWNNDPVLFEGLFKSGWAENFRKGMDFRIIEVYRKDCPDSPHILL